MKRILPILLLLCSQAFAANWYVLKGAAGTNAGTSWTNAWNEMNQVSMASVACGDTIWLGGGTYTTSLTINKICTSGSQLTINRVLSTDAVPVAAAGWNAAFDSQVIFNGAEILQPAGGAWYNVDGRKGNPQTGIAYGILIQCSVASGCEGVGPVNPSGNMANIHYSNMELFGPPCITANGSTAGNCNAGVGVDGFNIAPATHTVTNLTLTNLYIHRWSELIRCALWSNSTVERSWLADTRQASSGGEHEDVIFTFDQTNFTFRYNHVWLSPNDGVFFDGNCVTCTMYGNVYWHSGASYFDFFTGFTLQLIFINNTLSSDEVFGDFLCPGNCPDMNLQSTPNSSSIIKNNVFDHITFSGSGGTGAVNFNAYSSDVTKQDAGANSFTYSSSFTSNTQFKTIDTATPLNSDYHLTTVGAGNGLTTFGGKADTTVGQPYLTDMDGNTCTTNCNVGAFQQAVPPNLVNSCVVGNEANTSSITTPSCVNAAGNFLIVTTTAVRPASTLTLTDTCGDTFINANQSLFPFHDTIQDGDVYVWYVASAIGCGANTFHTVPTSGSSALEIHVSEWSNMVGWVPDQTSIANGSTGGLAFNSGSKTTTKNGELIFGYTFPLGNSSPGAGFTQITFVNGDIDEYQIQTTAGTASATFTSTNSGTWLALMQTFMAPEAIVQVATPVLSPVAGTYATAQSVTITSATSSATICYTVNGTTPTANGAGTCTNGTTLANGGAVTVSASETVQAIGTLSGDSDSAVGSATYTIGIPVASLSPASLSFGGINTSNTSAPQTLTLQNTGTAVMSITSISLTGANTGDYFQSNNCPVGSNLGNGASCTITVTFTPLAVGSRSASVSVADGSSGSPHTSTLSGSGVQASISCKGSPGAKISGRATVK